MLKSTSLIFWASCSVRSTKGRRRGPVSTPTNSKALFTGTIRSQEHRGTRASTSSESQGISHFPGKKR